MHLYVKKKYKQKLHQSSKVLTAVGGYIGESFDWKYTKERKRKQTVTTHGGLAHKPNPQNHGRPVSTGTTNTTQAMDYRMVLLILPLYFLAGFTESSDSRQRTDLPVAAEVFTSAVPLPSVRRYLPQKKGWLNGTITNHHGLEPSDNLEDW